MKAGKSNCRNRRPIPFECSPLESRLLFAAVYPTPQEQYVLQLINRARANPTAEVQRTAANNRWPAGVTPDLNEGLPAGTIPTTPKQPLAMNPFLLDAARKHTQYLFANPDAGHDETVNGVVIGPPERAIAAGYTNPLAVGENIWTSYGAIGGGGDPLVPLLALEQQPVVDTPSATRGHRLALFNGGYNEVGLGLGTMSVTSNGSTADQFKITQDFGNQGSTSFLCGVAFADQNADQFYEPGEQLGNVTITATRTSDGKVFSTTTWDSGGYSLPLSPGNYNVTASGGNVGAPAVQNVTISTLNMEANFIAANNAVLAAPVITTQPLDVKTSAGATSFSFNIAASGSPASTVQWQVAPFQSSNFTNIPAATSFTYTGNLDPSLNGNQYRAVVTNSQGSATSNVANLTIPNGAVLPVTITLKPTAQNVNAGDTVAFTAAATGYTKVVWQVLTPTGSGSTEIPGANSPTYTFTADPSMDGNTYIVFFSNNTDSQIAQARLTVNAAPAAPTVSVQPQPQTAPAGGSATLAVDATGFPDPSVQWQTDGAGATAAPALARTRSAPSWQNVPGGTGMTLTVPASSSGRRHHYRAVLSDGETSVTTVAVSVTANKRTAVSNDLTSLRTAAHAALAAIQACKRATDAVVVKLAADLRRLQASPAVKAQLNTLSTNERNARAIFTRNESKVLGAMLRSAARAVVDAARLKKHPGDATISAALQADLSTLQTAADSSTAPADATACKLATADALAPISDVAPSDAKLQSDVVTAQTNAYAIGQSLQAPMAIAQGIAARLGTDAQA